MTEINSQTMETSPQITIRQPGKLAQNLTQWAPPGIALWSLARNISISLALKISAASNLSRTSRTGTRSGECLARAASAKSESHYIGKPILKSLSRSSEKTKSMNIRYLSI